MSFTVNDLPSTLKTQLETSDGTTLVEYGGHKLLVVTRNGGIKTIAPILRQISGGTQAEQWTAAKISSREFEIEGAETSKSQTGTSGNR